MTARAPGRASTQPECPGMSPRSGPASRPQAGEPGSRLEPTNEPPTHGLEGGTPARPARGSRPRSMIVRPGGPRSLGCVRPRRRRFRNAASDQPHGPLTTRNTWRQAPSTGGVLTTVRALRGDRAGAAGVSRRSDLTDYPRPRGARLLTRGGVAPPDHGVATAPRLRAGGLRGAGTRIPDPTIWTSRQLRHSQDRRHGRGRSISGLNASDRNATEYVTQLSLARALAELPHVDDLTTLALDVGFSSHSHLSAAFRRALGMTPSQFRATSRQRLPRSFASKGSPARSPR